MSVVGQTVIFLVCDDQKSGYGKTIGGNEKHSDRDSVFEFYIIPSFRNLAFALFSELLKVCECNFYSKNEE